MPSMVVQKAVYKYLVKPGRLKSLPWSTDYTQKKAIFLGSPKQAERAEAEDYLLSYHLKRSIAMISQAHDPRLSIGLSVESVLKDKAKFFLAKIIAQEYQLGRLDYQLARDLMAELKSEAMPEYLLGFGYFIATKPLVSAFGTPANIYLMIGDYKKAAVLYTAAILVRSSYTLMRKIILWARGEKIPLNTALAIGALPIPGAFWAFPLQMAWVKPQLTKTMAKCVLRKVFSLDGFVSLAKLPFKMAAKPVEMILGFNGDSYEQIFAQLELPEDVFDLLQLPQAHVNIN